MPNAVDFRTEATDGGKSAVCSIDTVDTTLVIAPAVANYAHRVNGISFQATGTGIMRLYSGSTLIYTRNFVAGNFDLAVSSDCPLLQTANGQSLGVQFSVAESQVVFGYTTIGFKLLAGTQG